MLLIDFTSFSIFISFLYRSPSSFCKGESGIEVVSSDTDKVLSGNPTADIFKKIFNNFNNFSVSNDLTQTVNFYQDPRL